MHDQIDSKTVPDPEVTGLSYRIDIDPDYDSTPDDADCYTDSQKAAWSDGEWRYVGYTVTPVIDGDPIGSASDSLSGVEYGWFLLTDEDDNVIGRVDLDGLEPNRPDQALPGYAPEPDATFPGLSYPVPDMIREVRARLAALAAQLGARADALRAVLAQVTDGH